MEIELPKLIEPQPDTKYYIGVDFEEDGMPSILSIAICHGEGDDVVFDQLISVVNDGYVPLEAQMEEIITTLALHFKNCEIMGEKP